MMNRKEYSKISTNEAQKFIVADTFKIHPGRFIGHAVEDKRLSPEVFAKKCGLDLAQVKRVLSGEEYPDAHFIQACAEMFPFAWTAFERYSRFYREQHSS